MSFGRIPLNPVVFVWLEAFEACVRGQERVVIKVDNGPDMRAVQMRDSCVANEHCITNGFATIGLFGSGYSEVLAGRGDVPSQFKSPHPLAAKPSRHEHVRGVV